MSKVDDLLDSLSFRQKAEDAASLMGRPRKSHDVVCHHLKTEESQRMRGSRGRPAGSNGVITRRATTPLSSHSFIN